MNNPSIKKGELTTGKLALILGLLVAIVGVLWIQFAPDAVNEQLAATNVDVASSAALRRRSAPPKSQTAASQEGAVTKVPADAWPTIPLHEAIDYDPFAMPAGIAALLPKSATIAQSSSEATAGGSGEGVASSATDTNGGSKVLDDEAARIAATIAAAEALKLAQEHEKAEALRRAAAIAKHEAQVTKLKSAGVSAIVARGSERVALIGERVIHVGDLVDGMRVVAIRDDAVELAKPEDLKAMGLNKESTSPDKQ